MATPADVLTIIPARGGSKGIPRKNLAMLGGRPLVAWTIEASRTSRYVTRTVVSTEDAEIAKVARGWGASVRDRPLDLAGDDVSSHRVVEDAVAWAGPPDVLVLAHPTSPVRTAADFDGCVGLVLDGFYAAVSVHEPDRHPYHMITLLPDGRARFREPDRRPLPPRQRLPKVYAENGAVYAADYEYWVAHNGFWGPETMGYVMPRERSADIDEPWDLGVARAIAARYGISGQISEEAA